MKRADNSITWNPYNKVVQSHRTGEIDWRATNSEREKRGLRVPWTPRIWERESLETPVCSHGATKRRLLAN